MKKQARKPTGRKCACCTHSESDAINKAVVAGQSFRAIARQYGMNHASVSRHVETCLKLEIQALIQQKRIEKAIDHYQEISEQLAYAKKLRAAAIEYLSDPDDPDRLLLLPRPDDVEVIYDDYRDTTDQGNSRRKRDLLSTLLERAERQDNVVDKVFALKLIERCRDEMNDPARKTIQRQSVVVALDTILESIEKAVVTTGIYSKQTTIKHVDIRSFALDAIRAVDLVLDKVAKVEGLYQQDRENREKLARTIKAITDYLEKHPDIDREKVIEAFAVGRGIPRETIHEHLGVIG
jgi:hypothetical protein